MSSKLNRLATLVVATLCMLLASCGGSDDVTGPGPGPGPGPGGSSSDSARFAVMETASDLYVALKGTPDRNASTLTYLQANANIEAAGVSDSLGNVWARFDDGRLLLLLDNKVETPGPQRIGRDMEALRAIEQMRDEALLLGSELPASRNARLLHSLEARWGSSVPTLTTILQTSGYQVSAPHSGISDLLNVQGDGVLYWASHAGEGNDRQNNGVFGIWTETLSDSVRDRVDPIVGMWANNEICYACTEVMQPNGSLQNECHYAVSQHFIRNRMSFSANSVVFIDACTSAKEEIRDAFFAKNAGIYCGWSTLTSGSSGIVGTTFFDVMCGANVVTSQSPAPRPYLFDWVRDWMVSNGKNVDPGGTAHLYMNRNPQKPQTGLLRPTIHRMFVHDSPAEAQDYLEIEGDFGLDPGPTERAVTIGGVALTGVTWSEHLITLPLPLNGPTSFGDVTVKSRGHLSNVAHLTRWVVPVTYFRYGQGSLTQQIDMSFIMRGDAGVYRMAPFAAPIGLANAITASKASSGTFLMSGIYEPDPEHYTKWKDNGALEAAKNAAQTTQVGYTWALGNINPGARTIQTFTPTAFAQYTVETESSSNPAVAALTPFSSLTLSFDASYVVRADSAGPVSVSGGSARIKWGPAQPDAPFNNGGR